LWQSSNDRNRKERGYARVNQQVNWVNDFEKEFRLKFFGNPTAESTEEKKIMTGQNFRLHIRFNKC
jgi:ADP-dependent phosphofructokinase/glucokinase